VEPTILRPLHAPTVVLLCLAAGAAGGAVGSVVGFLGSIALVCVQHHGGNCALASVFLAGPLAAVGAVVGVLWTVVILYRRRHASLTIVDAWLIVGLGGIGGVLGGFAPIIGTPVCFLGICGLRTFYVTAAVGLVSGLILAGGVVYPWRKRLHIA
jgi:hypothetical protein